MSNEEAIAELIQEIKLITLALSETRQWCCNLEMRLSTLESTTGQPNTQEVVNEGEVEE